MAYSDYIVYVDESGDHSLSSIDQQYPIFALTFCLFKKTDYADCVVPLMQHFKFRHFGHDTVVLHEHSIRKQISPFVFLKSQAKRAVFLGDLTAMIQASPMTIISAVIHKDQLVRRYAQPANPYELALLFCVERLYAHLRGLRATDALTHIIVECRGKKEDDALELEFRRIADGANMWGKMNCLKLLFAEKRSNLAGLQLADLTARPIGLSSLRPGQPNRAYAEIEPKIRRSPKGEINGWGFKSFP